jgi:monovalent cation:H+ antiporter-2, CPA2 family
MGNHANREAGAAKLEPILILAGKFVIWSAVVWLFRYPTKTAILVGLGLTQIGEFSYVLVRVARDSHLVGDDVYNAMLAA